MKVKTMDWVYQHQWKAHQKDQERKEKTSFLPVIKSKNKQVLERRFDHLAKTLGNLTDAIKDDSSQLFVEFLREDAKRKERRD